MRFWSEVVLPTPTITEVSFFNMVAGISGSFALAATADIDAVINHALATIGDFYQADRCYVFTFSEDLATASNSHEWCAPGVSSQLANLQNLSAAEFGHWYVNWQQGLASIISDVAALPNDSAEYQLLSAQGIQSLLMLPLRNRNRLIGMFGLDLVSCQYDWPQEQVAGLQLIAGNICGTLLRQRSERQAQQMAFYDQLTGLANRQLMFDRVMQAQQQSQRNNQYACLLFVDIDQFKMINETLGYATGDKVLKLVAESLHAALPQGDTVGRLNADEFLILIEMLPSDRALAVQQVSDLAALIFAIITANSALQQIQPKLTLSIGATLFQGHSDAMDVLITQADMAMFQAKQQGGNNLALFDQELQLQATRRILLANELREAIAQDQFELFYQPQVVHPGVVTGAEVLVRWRHPSRGLLGPYEFIEFAEQSGLIVPLGEWVLRKACQQLAVWQKQPVTSSLELSVNISVRQFRQRDFADIVLGIVKETAIDASALKLELTESILVDDVETLVAKMQLLQQQGLRFALDDFGTGYSSLVYLKRLPLQQLKIDRGFIKDLLLDDSDQAIVRTIIVLGQTLGLEVLAEGVESIEQLRALLKLGCYHYQGYHFARPLPLNDFIEFLQHHNPLISR